MKEVLVTGGTGFVGANLVRRLLLDDHHVHLVVRPGYHKWRIEEIKADLIIHEIDLLNLQQLTSEIQRIKPEWVFHLATNGAYSWQNDSTHIMSTNVAGTVNFVDACVKAGFEKLVYTGSSSEYGLKSHAPAENEWLDPNSLYAVTKAFGTQYCRYVALSKGIDVYSLRLYSVYGPFEEPGRFIPRLIIEGIEKKLPPLVDPKVARDFIYVDDVIDAYLQLAGSADIKPGTVFNVGTGKQTTIEDAVRVSMEVFGFTCEPQWGKYASRSWDTETWQANNSHIKNELGWQPKFSFERGFRKTLDWFMANPQFTSTDTQKGIYANT